MTELVSTRRSTVLSLPLQKGFPALAYYGSELITSLEIFIAQAIESVPTLF
jgi:hypothetical protein